LKKKTAIFQKLTKVSPQPPQTPFSIQYKYVRRDNQKEKKCNVKIPDWKKGIPNKLSKQFSMAWSLKYW